MDNLHRTMMLQQKTVSSNRDLMVELVARRRRTDTQVRHMRSALAPTLVLSHNNLPLLRPMARNLVQLNMGVMDKSRNSSNRGTVSLRMVSQHTVALKAILLVVHSRLMDNRQAMVVHQSEDIKRLSRHNKDIVLPGLWVQSLKGWARWVLVVHKDPQSRLLVVLRYS